MKIRSLLRRFFRGWFPAEPQTSNHWSKNKLRIALFLASSIIVVSAITIGVWNLAATPQMILPQLPPELLTLRSDYLPGVTVGDYVTYGNFVCNFSRPAGPWWDWIPNLGDVYWQKVEVFGVSGKEVILRYTEQFKNGSATGHSGCVHIMEDIEYPALINGSCQFQDYYFGSIVAANLTEGDCIHSEPCPAPACNIAKNEVRTYLDVSRWVNIMESRMESHLTTWVYDGESGMLLEYEEIIPNNERISYGIIETNIFSSPTPSPRSSMLQETTAQPILTVALSGKIGLLIITIFALAVIIFKKKKIKRR